MNDEQNIVYTQGLLLQARIEMEAMMSENQVRAYRHPRPAYGEESFIVLIEKYCVHHNGLITNLVGH